jgi:hypothetical protein
MTRYRAFALLAVLVFAVSSLSAPAWAHPGHMPDEPAGSTLPESGELGSPHAAAVTPLAAPRHRGPSAVALLAGALALLANLPDRRRTLALVVTVLLGAAVSEGAFHALLHLRHLAHSDGLVVGPSAAQQAATDPEGTAPATLSLPLVGKAAPERRIAPQIERALASDRGRAPPISPA